MCSPKKGEFILSWQQFSSNPMPPVNQGKCAFELFVNFINDGQVARLENSGEYIQRLDMWELMKGTTPSEKDQATKMVKKASNTGI